MNKNWRKLKQSSNGIPTWDSLLPYILEVIRNGEETTNKVIKERLMDYFKLPEEVLQKTHDEKPNSEPIIFSRVSFTLSALYKASAVKRPKRSVYQITSIGKELLEQYDDKLTLEILEAQPEYKEYVKELEVRNKRTDGKAITEVNPDLEFETEIDIEKLVNSKNNETGIELLDKIRSSNPYFFERLVVDLLDRMGYSGENGEAKVTSRSNDGGIDGLINQDPLGTSTVYIQAKRYKEDNVIGRQTVQSFYGALAGIRADRGVLITTSSFTKGAKDYAKNQGIVLVGGIQLTDLMLKYEVGIEKEQEYVVYRIDNDYFDEEE